MINIYIIPSPSKVDMGLETESGHWRLSTKDRLKRTLRLAGERKSEVLKKRILNAISQLEAEGEIATFSKLSNYLKVSTRTLAKYLRILEEEKVIFRKKVGELKAILVNDYEKKNFLESIESPELSAIFRKNLVMYALEVYEFLEYLTYYDVARRKLSGDFPGLSYKKFFKKFKLNILGLLMKMADLEPLSEKQRVLWYAIFDFLKRNLNTLPLIVDVFFPIIEIPKRELKKIPQNLILLMKSLPKDFHPPPRWYEPQRRIISEKTHGPLKHKPYKRP